MNFIPPSLLCSFSMFPKVQIRSKMPKISSTQPLLLHMPNNWRKMYSPGYQATWHRRRNFNWENLVPGTLNRRHTTNTGLPSLFHESVTVPDNPSNPKPRNLCLLARFLWVLSQRATSLPRRLFFPVPSTSIPSFGAFNNGAPYFLSCQWLRFPFRRHY